VPYRGFSERLRDILAEIEEIQLSVLGKDWLNAEEDQAWQDL
jgi:hypothetical protein